MVEFCYTILVFVINFLKGDIPPIGSGSPSRLHCVHHYSLLEIGHAIEAKIYGLFGIVTCIKEYLQYVDKNAFQWVAYHPLVDRMWGGSVCLGVCVPCDLSHHAFDVTCMLLPHQLRPNNGAAAYILLVGHVTCKACWDTPPYGQTDTCENITFANYVYWQ